MDKLEIGIVETRNIIKSIKDKYGYDFSNYALTSLKRHFVKVMNKYNLEEADLLIKKIEVDDLSMDEFLYNFSIETTEMFRDPSLWRALRDELIPNLVRDSENSKIWVTGDSSGEELYSLAILLKESGFIKKVDIVMSYMSDIQLEQIKEGGFNSKKIEVNDANYKRFNGKYELSDYYINKSNTFYWDTSLIKNVSFKKQNIIFDDSPKRIKLILFRNNMIYYNQILQDEILKTIHKSLLSGGYLIIGDKESLKNCILCEDFVLAHKGESIYKKKAIS